MGKLFHQLLVMLILCSIAFKTVQAQGYDITVKIKDIKDTAAYLGYNFGDLKVVLHCRRGYTLFILPVFTLN
jgi:hypothetical protein